MTPIREEWPGKINGRERFNRLMHFKSVDRCFNMEFGYWNENFSEWSIFRENDVKNNAEADKFFNFDRIEYIVGNTSMSPLFKEEVISIKNGIKTIINRHGLIAEIPEDGHDTIPHYLKSSIVTPDDWKRCKEERFRRGGSEREVDIEKLKQEHPESRVYPLGIDCGSMIGGIRDMLTFEGLAYALYDYPEMVEDMVETCCLLVEDLLDKILPHFQFDYASGWEDICFKNGPIVPVPFFGDVIVPRYKRINKKLKAHGIDLWYIDCDGDVRPILDHFLDGGVNCLFPFEVMGCTHPGILLDKYPGQLRIMGGFDKIQLGGGREAIKKYMESLLPYVERGGYIPFCDHRCPPNVPEQDYLYYLDLKRSMFGLDSPLYSKNSRNPGR